MPSRKMKRALLLNADYTPLHFISDVDAIVLLYKGRAEVIVGANDTLSEWDETFRSPSMSIRVPATMRLLRRVPRKWKQPRFRKRVLFNRDNWQCQFCGAKLNSDTITVDHIVPTSRGGTTTWLNCVAACRGCNRKKANAPLESCGLTLLRRPTIPTPLHFWDSLRSAVWHSDWDTFLSPNA